jgi:hypothetical protein
MAFVSWSEDHEGNEKMIVSKTEQYLNMRESWKQVIAEASPTFTLNSDIPHKGAVGDENENSDVVSKLQERKYRIDKDVARTDQTIDFFKVGAGENALREAIDEQSNLVKLRNICMTYTIFNFELGIEKLMQVTCKG